MQSQLASLLPPGSNIAPVIPYDEPSTWNAFDSTSSVIRLDPDGAVPAPNAKRIQVLQATNPRWDAGMHSRNSTGTVRRNDLVLLSFWMRSAGQDSAEQAVAWVGVEMSRAPYTGFLGQSVAATSTWTQIFSVGRAVSDFQPGDLRVVFHLGLQSQTVDIAGLQVINLGPSADMAKMPFTKLTYAGRDPKAAWRDEAQRRIERYRMAVLKVKVVNAEGQPLSGATVNVNMTKREFGVGSLLESFTGQRTPAEAQQELAIFKRLFNRGTTPIFWADWGWPTRRTDYLASAKWLADNGMQIRGHAMIYPDWGILPSAVRPLQTNKTALRQRFLQQIREIAQATREFGFREYDVTNELRELTAVIDVVGRDAVAEWFAEASVASPNAKMALNENTILTFGGATEYNQQNLLDWYKFLSAKGESPDVIGMQGHFGQALTSPERIWEIFDRFQRETRAEIQITEFDLDTRDEQAQAEYTRDFFTACFAHPAVTGITIWGFWGDMYVPNGAFFRRDFSPKPNGVMLEELLTKTWWTNLSGETKEEGEYTGKAFLGTLNVTVKHGNTEVKQTVRLDVAGGETLLTVVVK